MWNRLKRSHRPGLALIVFLLCGLTPTALPDGGPTWQVGGGQTGSQFGATVGSAGDVNGDGIADIIVGAPHFDTPRSTSTGEGRAFVYLGSPLGPATTPAWTADGVGTGFGGAIASAGDVNGDGFDDIIAGEPESGYFNPPDPPWDGQVTLYLGSASGPGTTPAWVAHDPHHEFYLNYGSSVAAAGDVNGDGYADVIVGAPTDPIAGSYSARAYLYLGSPAGLGPSTNPAWSAQGDFGSTNSFGTTVAGAGDVNGDGYDDVLVGDPQHPSARADCRLGKVYIYLGSLSGLSAQPAWTIVGQACTISSSSAFAGCTLDSGDFDGDPYSDILVGCATPYASSLFRGSPSGPVSTAWVGGEFARNAGDVDGDGFDDVISSWQGGTATAAIFLGGASGPAATPVWTVDGAFSFAGAGDTDGDHRSNILVGNSSYSFSLPQEGAAFLFFGPVVVPCSVDVDGDGWCALGPAADCNDTNPAVHPNQAELCNSIDDDCDGSKDEGFNVGTFCTEGLGICTMSGRIACTADGTSSSCNGPPEGAPSTEICDGLDNDCDGSIDENLPDASLCRISSTSQRSARLGTSVADVGDVNGDGFADVVAGAPGDGHGRINLHYGSASGAFGPADWTYMGTQIPTGISIGAEFGASVAGIGDLNRDGYDDFIVGSPGYSFFQFESFFGSYGAFDVFLGGVAGPSFFARTMLPSPAPFGFGAAVAGGGDLDGDGLGDYLVSARTDGVVQTTARVAIYTRGGTAWTTRSGTGAYARAIAIAPDVNGDGFDEVLISDGSQLHVYYGQAAGIGASPSLVVPATTVSIASIAGVGDVDQDGYGDVLLGGFGRAVLLRGSAAGLAAMPAWSFSDPAGFHFGIGSSVDSAGDQNSDGYPDLIVGFPNAVVDGKTQGAAYLFAGGPSGPGVSPVWTGALAGQAGAQFGAAVSGAGDYDGDGVDDLVIGSPSFNSGGAPQAGRVDLIPWSWACDADHDGFCADNCPLATNPGQEDANADGSGDACQPTVSIDEFRFPGADLIEALVSMHDPQGEPLSGVITIEATTDLPDVSQTGDCGSGYLPAGVPGEGVAFVEWSAEERLLVDLGSYVGCGDGVADYDLAYGRCAQPQGPFDTVLSLSGLSLPALVCVRPFHGSAASDGVDLTILAIDSGAATVLIGGSPPVIETPFASSLPPAIDISVLAFHRPFVLSITATDGNTLPSTGSGIFQHAAERTLAFVVPRSSPPVAAIVAPASPECSGSTGASVALDGSGSSDPDSTPGTNDDIAAFDWYENFGTAGERLLGSGETLTVDLALGAHAVTLRTTDYAGQIGTASTTVTVVDTQAPSLALNTDPATLWPPNHGLMPVNVGWVVGDACDPSGVTVTLVSVSSSEPDDAAGGTDGATVSDIDSAVVGAADAALLLRAERDGSGSGRVYTLTYLARDGSGNATTALATVTVPHDLGQGPEPLLMRLEPASPGSAGVRIFWPAVAGATGYDVITGDLQEWHVTNGTLDVGRVRALARSTTTTSLIEAAGTANPPAGRAFFYLIQQHMPAPVGYGTESAPLPRIAVICEDGCPGAAVPPAGSGKGATVRR